VRIVSRPTHSTMNASPDTLSSSMPRHPRTLAVLLHLTEPSRNGECVFKMIRRLGDWWNCLHDIWLVKSALPVEVICAELQALLKGTDSVLVLEVGTDASWIGLERQAAGWVKDNLLTHGSSPLARARRGGCLTPP